MAGPFVPKRNEMERNNHGQSPTIADQNRNSFHPLGVDHVTEVLDFVYEHRTLGGFQLEARLGGITAMSQVPNLLASKLNLQLVHMLFNGGTDSHR